MNKIELRNKYKLIRKNISNKEEKSDIIINKILNLKEYKSAKTVALYYSLIDEVNTLKLIEKSLKEKITLLPRVINDNEMTFFLIENINDLEVGSFNIKEPTTNIEMNNIDLMIIPGICFDKNRNRIGFGKGYYDKYLCNHDIYKIGICFDEQIFPKMIESNINDIKMDLIITEKRNI